MAGMYQMDGAYGEPVIMRIGEIDVTSATVRTPAGAFPLRGSQWTVTDQWTVTQRIPQWAIVSAIIGFCCLTVFSLLFLLAKETIYTGAVTVSVSNGPALYVARIPVATQDQVQYVYNQVNYVRSLSLI
jgi:hypothetical protein